MELSPRQITILSAILRENLKTALPVSSGVLVEKYDLGFSPATVRNEMMALEEAGYIFQPHTSSGRIPAESAWRLWLDIVSDNASERKLSSAEKNIICESLSGDSLKLSAKALAEISNLAVYWAFNKRDFYYTGLANLFSQPELKHLETVYDVSLAIDKMEEVVEGLLENSEFGINTLIGEDNPFGPFLGTTFLKYGQKNREAMVGILGPLRLDYGRAMGLLEIISEKINK